MACRAENSMDFKGYETVSGEVKSQIAAVVDAWRAILGDGALLGAYLQGSMALGRYAEGLGDIDLLFVTSRRIPRDERLLLADAMIKLDYKPATIEMSALYIGDISPWRHPAPCQFHYSNGWTERYRDMLSGKMPECFIIDEDFEDADIACHVRLTRQYGVCLFGAPACDTLPPVPEADFVDSLMNDIDDVTLEGDDEAELTSGVLSLARVLSYMVERRIMSKYDAALWAISRAPANVADIVSCALEARYMGKPWRGFGADELQECREYFISQIRAFE